MFERRVDEVEVNPFHEHVAGDKDGAVGVGEDGAVVAYPVARAFLGERKVFGEVADEAELAECGYFGTFHRSVNWS